jgi:hypothetical protein
MCFYRGVSFKNGVFLKQNFMKKVIFYPRISVENTVFLNIEKSSINSEFYWQNQCSFFDNIPPVKWLFQDFLEAKGVWKKNLVKENKNVRDLKFLMGISLVLERLKIFDKSEQPFYRVSYHFQFIGFINVPYYIENEGTLSSVLYVASCSRKTTFVFRLFQFKGDLRKLGLIPKH